MCKPASYPPNDAEEQEAINALTSNLDLKQVKPDIKFRDKHPNIDGTLELVDASSSPIGKLDIQVRKIPDGSRSYSCPIELYAYSKVSSLPVLLIACDTKQNKVMWKHISVGMPEYKEGQKTFTIKFSLEDEIGESSPYLRRWRDIVTDYNQRVQEYSKLEARISKELDLDGVNDKDLSFFQEYAKELNLLLDKDFQVIKERILPRAWKIGIGIARISDESIAYQHHRIDKGINLPSVIRVDSKPPDKIFEDPTVFQFTIIEKRGEMSCTPREKALDFLKPSVEKAFKGFHFVIHGHDVAQNVLCEFAEQYPNCLGINPKSEYTLTELQRAFYENLPKTIGSCFPPLPPNSRGIIDLWSMECSSKHFPFSKPNHIPALSSYIMRTRDLSLQAFEDALNYSNSNDIETIKNPWGPLGEHDSPSIWSYKNKEVTTRNIRQLLEKLIMNYTRFVRGNQLYFPKSPYLSPDITVVYIIDTVENSDYFSGCPIVKEYHVDNRNLDCPKQIVVTPQNENSVAIDKQSRSIVINGKTKTIFKIISELADWMFRGYPYLKGVYRMLASDLSEAYKYKFHVY